MKIDGLAASAASVIAMAGTEVWMSPVSMMMIHNPATVVSVSYTHLPKRIWTLFFRSGAYFFEKVLKRARAFSLL